MGVRRVSRVLPVVLDHEHFQGQLDKFGPFRLPATDRFECLLEETPFKKGPVLLPQSVSVVALSYSIGNKVKFVREINFVVVYPSASLLVSVGED